MPSSAQPKEPAAAGEAQWPRAILHLDMDAFFVNVHLLDHPQHAGLPLVVGGRPEHRGVVAAASYEARRFGIQSAMPMRTAVQRCPSLLIVGHSWPRISECSQRVMAILESFGPIEPMSVDEAYVDLSGTSEPRHLAQAIKARVRQETSLPASVGLAACKLVAKVASDHGKPDGYTVVPPGSEAGFLAPLPVRAIHGVGPKTAERLVAIGLSTCGQLAAASPDQLSLAFGKYGEVLRRLALGEDTRPVSQGHARKSISSETTFDRDIADGAVLADRVTELARDAGRSLRRRGMAAKTVAVKFRWADFTTYTRQRTLAAFTDRDEDLVRVALDLWREHWPAGQPIRLLGVGVSGLTTKGRQLALDL
jgi:DNA polymerase-4